MDSALNASIAKEVPLPGRSGAVEGGLKRRPRATPPVDDHVAWRKLLNHLYFYKEDELFRWAKAVRTAVGGEDDGRAEPEEGTA